MMKSSHHKIKSTHLQSPWKPQLLHLMQLNELKYFRLVSIAWEPRFRGWLIKGNNICFKSRAHNNKKAAYVPPQFSNAGKRTRRTKRLLSSVKQIPVAPSHASTCYDGKALHYQNLWLAANRSLRNNGNLLKSCISNVYGRRICLSKILICHCLRANHEVNKPLQEMAIEACLREFLNLIKTKDMPRFWGLWVWPKTIQAMYAKKLNWSSEQSLPGCALQHS